MGDETRGGSDGLAGLDDASNVFVLSSSMDGSKRAVCSRLFQRTPPEDTNALVVTYAESADRWLSHYEEVTGGRPAEVTVLSVGEVRQHARAGAMARTRGVDIERIDSPTDLTGVGIRVSEFFREAVETRRAGGPGEITVCFDSVTALLQYTSVSEAFRFLHVLAARTRQADATAHYHLVSGAHEQQTVSTLAPLFDGQVDATAGSDPDDWRVK